MAAAATEDIDSEWPEDDEASAPNLEHPVFPTAAKVPAEAASLDESNNARASKRPTLRTEEMGKPSGEDAQKPGLPHREKETNHEGETEQRGSLSPSPVVALGEPDTEAARDGKHLATDATSPERQSTAPAATATPSEPPKREQFSEPSIERFEAAASSFDSDRAFGMRESEPPTASATEASEGTRSGESLAPSQSDSKPPPVTKKKSTTLAISLAAAAVVLAGIGLATRGGDLPDPNLDRSENALKPDPASEPKQGATKAATPETKPEPAAPAPAPSALEAASADAAEGETETAEGETAEGEAADGEAKDAAASDDAAKDDGESMAVQVNVFPPDTQIYHKGKLLARAGGTIALKKGEKKLLVLIRDGYWPRKLILDGSETVYNIGLREQPPSTFLPEKTSDKPTPPSAAPAPKVEEESAAPKAAASAPAQ